MYTGLNTIHIINLTSTFNGQTMNYWCDKQQLHILLFTNYICLKILYILEFNIINILKIYSNTYFHVFLNYLNLNFIELLIVFYYTYKYIFIGMHRIEFQMIPNIILDPFLTFSDTIIRSLFLSITIEFKDSLKLQYFINIFYFYFLFFVNINTTLYEISGICKFWPLA